MTSIPPATGTPFPDYQFTSDWFAPNIPIWDKLVPRFKPRRVLEVGSYEGRSTCYLIEICTAQSDIEIHCIDSWQGGVEHDKSTMSDVEARFDANVAIARGRAPHAVKLVKHKNLSHVALADLFAAERAATFDIIYIDGSHQAPDVLSDCVLAFHLLRVGGLMIFDDYIWSMESPGKQDPLNMPKLAIDSFLNVFQRKMQIVRGAPVYQLYAIKTGA